MLADQVTVRTARCRRTLGLEDAEVVAVPVITGCILAEQRAQRADLPARFVRPIQAVALAGCAENLPGVFQGAITVVVLRGVVHLRIVIGKQRLHSGQLVPANAPGTNLGTAGLEVKAPATGS
ncbi:hypothetical protein D3C81_1934480 [compost metagenome]